MDPRGMPNFSLKKCLSPILTVNGTFITARIALEQNERLARRADAAKFLIEAKMGLWMVNEDYSYLKGKHNLKAFHFAEDK